MKIDEYNLQFFRLLKIDQLDVCITRLSLIAATMMYALTPGTS